MSIEQLADLTQPQRDRLEINPLDLIKRLAHAKRVVAVWPGELRGSRLYYAEMTHPEYRDYDADGVVTIEI